MLNYQTNRQELDQRIKNIASLPTGLNCKYLLTIKGKDNSLIAKQWKRKQPKKLNDNEVVIKF